MASSLFPVRAAAYVLDVALISQANTKIFQAAPTLAAGDVKVSIDEGALANLTTLPTVTPAGGKNVKVSLSAAEMTGDRIVVIFSDAADSEWCDLHVPIQTSAVGVDTLGTDLDDIQTRLPAALVSGRIDASVGAIATGAITAASIAADAITDAKVASDVTIASVTGAVGSVTGAVGSVTGAVGSIATGGIAAASFAAGAIDAAAIATDAIGAAELAADAVTEIQSGLATAAALATVQADTDDIQTRLPAALVTGRMDSSVGAVAAGAITAAAIATDAIDADALAASAVDEILDDVVEGAVTLRQALRIILSFVGAKVTGGGTTTLTYRDIGDTKSRITQTVDSSGNRSASTLDGS